MPKNDNRNTDELFNRLRWLMLLRVVLISFALGVAIVFQIKYQENIITPSLAILYGLIGVTYLLTLAYSLYLNKIKNYARHVYLQLVLDSFCISVAIFATGGIDSLYSLMYMLNIIAASIVLYRRGGLIIASINSIIYGTLVDLQFYEIIEPWGTMSASARYFQPGYALYHITMYILSFYAVAFLTSYLSLQMKNTQVMLRAKQLDLDQLSIFSDSIIQSLESGLITLNNELRITYLNRAAEQIIGQPFSHLFNRPIKEIFPGLGRLIRTKSIPQGLTLDQRRDYVPFARTGGQRLFLSFSQSALYDPNGRQVGRILLFNDRTSFKEMEEHIKRIDRLAVAGELAAGVAHEIRNPLASISGSVQVLQNEPDLTPVNKRLMDIVVREVDRLNHLVEEFLLLSKPDLPKGVPIDISQVVDETLDVYNNSTNLDRVIVLKSDLTPRLVVDIDPEQLRQVLWNLLANATDAMPAGGTITVTTREDEKKTIYLGHEVPTAVIEVEDTGEGIAPDDLDSLFIPFFTTKERGTGLGLAISLRIVENYSGRIVVDSKPGQGTVFAVYLPMVPS
ncbi:MAG: PAS domain-containing protein [Deltaproteobacteria bacterium]|nr:PAS domain-containing protein [Deltaproteobacteria bacterium]